MDRDTVAARFPSAAVYTDQAILAAYHRWGAATRGDSKTFVDRPLTADPDEVLRAFQRLPTCAPGDADDAAVRDAYAAFFATYFDADPDAASVQVAHAPADFDAAPPAFLAAHGDTLPPEAAEFALALKRMWAKLCRVSTEASRHATGRSSLIPLPRPFFIAGGRFRECYYWDSYWIVKGLLACDMVASARDVADNLLHLVSLCSFVPNGNRVYYLNRSQPPLLTLTVAAILDRTRDAAWLHRALPLLDREYTTFIASHHPDPPAPTTAITPTAAAALSALAVYRVDAAPAPRPESWAEDAATGAAAGAGAAAAACYRGIAAAAESGWDFSSRWLAPGGDGGLASIRTPHIVPVCLNAVLVKTERALARLHAMPRGEASSCLASAAAASQRYAAAADRRAAALNALLWDADRGTWCDWDTTTGASTGVVAASGVYPVWAGCWPARWAAADAEAYVRRLEASGLVQAGGLAATTAASGEQWDFPNAWPPLAEAGVAGLEALARAFPGCGAAGVARRVARATLRGMFGEWRRAGVMHEKYDAREVAGGRGGGGEYAPQVGFGWSNGVALVLLEKGYWF
jgi:alpha,alpha-trehalase